MVGDWNTWICFGASYLKLGLIIGACKSLILNIDPFLKTAIGHCNCWVFLKTQNSSVGNARPEQAPPPT